MNNKYSYRLKDFLKYLFIAFYALILVSNVFGQTEAELIYNWNDNENIPEGWGGRYNDCWGFEHEGTEYGVIGSTLGTHIIDLDAVDSLREVAFIPGKFSSRQVVHRDHHEYNGYLYAVCDQGTSSLQVIDVSQLPNDAPLVYDDSLNISRAHNVFVDTATNKLYTCGVRKPDFASVPLQVWSIEDPARPQLIAEISEIQGVSISYVHDLYARNDTVFLNAGNQGLVIADMSDVERPRLFGVLANYPDAGYNHSGWWNERGDRYYLADETHGMDIKIVDVSDIRNPRVIQLINAESDPEASVVHNLIVKNDMLYVSYYFDGFQAFDVSGDTSSCRSYSFATSSIDPVRGGFDGAWGVYPLLPSGRVIVSDMQNGLFLLELPDLEVSDTSGVDGTPPCQPVMSTANLRFLNNAADVNLDIYVSETKMIEDLSFREASSFQTIDAERDIEVSIAPAGGTIENIVFAETFNFEKDRDYLVVSQGVLGSVETPLELKLIEDYKVSSINEAISEVLFLHGVPDAQEIDVLANGGAFIEDLPYGDYSDYFTLPPSIYELTVTPAMDNSFEVGSYVADLQGRAGETFTVFASGLLNGNSEDLSFGLWALLADGTTYPLPIISSTVERIEDDLSMRIGPNPASDFAMIYFNEPIEVHQIDLINLQGHVVQKYNRSLPSHQLGTYKFNLQHVPSGAYLLRITSSDKTYLGKISVLK